MSYRTSDELATYFILLDEQDRQILALAQGAARTRLLSQLYEGTVYYITNFKVVVGPTEWKAVAEERAIIFGHQTQARACYDRCSIPKFSFELCPLPITSHLGNFKHLIDVCGVVLKVGNIIHNKHGIQKLNKQLMDESCAVVTISQWGIKSAQFETKFEIYRKKNVALVVTGLRVRGNNGTAYLASTLATKFYFDPSYKALGNLGRFVASRFGDFLCRLPITETYEHLHPIAVLKKTLTLQAIKEPSTWVHPKLLKMRAFYCKVTIKEILSTEEWCFKPIPVDDVLYSSKETYHCNNC